MTQRTTLAALRRSTALLAISLAFFACSNDISEPDIAIKGYSPLLLNFTSDNYETGELRWMDANSTSLLPDTLSFFQDSKVFASGKNIFVLQRTPMDNISCMQVNNFGISQFALEQGANPYDIAIAGNKGYIALNGADYVQTFDINTCALGEKINLPITQANASSIKISGDTLLILSQRLENWSATKPGLLIRINATTEALIDTIPLNFYNPSSSVLSNEKLYVSSQKYNDDFTIDLEKSGIEVVDLNTRNSEIIATGTELGGGANIIVLDENRQTLYASVYISWGTVPVKPINLNGNIINSALPGITDSFNGLVFDSESGKLFIADAGGLKVYNTATQITTPISGNALPPYSLAIARW